MRYTKDPIMVSHSCHPAIFGFSMKFVVALRPRASPFIRIADEQRLVWKECIRSTNTRKACSSFGTLDMHTSQVANLHLGFQVLALPRPTSDYPFLGTPILLEASNPGVDNRGASPTTVANVDL